jgi:starch phosphorylase
VGWALGDGREHGDDPDWDAVEAAALYDLLEQSVIPEFHKRDKDDIPTAWVKRMRESMAQLTPRFSAHRTVREYTDERYLPAATTYRERAANKGIVGKQVVDWQHSLEQEWGGLHFGEVKVETRNEQHIFGVQVYLNSLDAQAIRVELYAGGINGADPVREVTKCGGSLPDGHRGCMFHATVPAARPASDYTPRVIPQQSGVAIPLESAHILWQR